MLLVPPFPVSSASFLNRGTYVTVLTVLFLLFKRAFGIPSFIFATTAFPLWKPHDSFHRSVWQVWPFRCRCEQRHSYYSRISLQLLSTPVCTFSIAVPSFRNKIYSNGEMPILYSAITCKTLMFETYFEIYIFKFLPKRISSNELRVWRSEHCSPSANVSSLSENHFLSSSI